MRSEKQIFKIFDRLRDIFLGQSGPGKESNFVYQSRTLTKKVFLNKN